MGFLDSLSSLLFAEAYAEAPEAKDDEETGDEGSEGGEKEAKEAAGEDKDGEEEPADEEPAEAEEEEEEEEEPEDLMPKFQEECAETAACKPHKYEYEECVERVKAAEEAGEEHKGPKEDCVEEFFEYTHCIAQCAAPKLFKNLA